MNSNAIWITWENQTRNHSMTRELDVPLYELISQRSGITRYVELIIKTYLLVRKKLPDIVFCQNPSLILAFFCTFFLKGSHRKIIVDEHNAGLFPYEGKRKLLNLLANYVIKHADLLIVTNEDLAGYCTSLGGNPVVIPDPLPDLPRHPGPKTTHPFQVLFICSWSEDEPYKAVFEACRSFPEHSIKIIVTGKPKDVAQNDLPACIHLVGFLPREQYFQLLQESDAVMVLTTRDNCLNCGAYEAVKAQKPGILSDKKVLRDHFRKGFLYTNNTIPDLEDKIAKLKSNFQELKSSLPSLEDELEHANRQRIELLLARIAQLI